MAIGINIHGESGASINLPAVNASDKREVVRRSAGSDPADGNDIGIAGKTGIANIDVVGNNARVHTGVSAYRSDVIASAVIDERISSNRRIVRAGGVEQQRYSAHCGIATTRVEDQRASTNTRVEVTGGIQKQRTPANRCISSAGSEALKRVASFRCREGGIAPVRWRSHRLHL